MNVQEELHRLIDTLDVSDAKRRLHVLVNELDDETASRLLTQVETIRGRRSSTVGWMT